MGTSAGIGKVSASGSPSALMDNCLQDKLGGVVKVSEGDSAKGVQVQTLEDGRLEAELYVTDSQKNSADGKTEGVYTGLFVLGDGKRTPRSYGSERKEAEHLQGRFLRT